MAALPEEQRQAGNLEENVINHRIGDDEIDTDEDIEENQLPRRRNVRAQFEEGWQAAAVANVVGDSLRLRSRKWDKYIDMLLRLPFLFLLDQILLKDMGWNGLNNLVRNNATSQGVDIDASAQGDSDNVQFHFTSDPNFTARKDAYLSAKQEAENRKYINVNNANSNDTLRIPIVQATAAELYQSLYGNPDWVALPQLALGYCVLSFIVALFVVLALNTRQLKMFYTYVLCGSLIPLSFKINDYTITQLSSTEADILSEDGSYLLSLANRIIVSNYCAQAGIGYLLSLLLRDQMNNNVYWLISDMLPFTILIPSILILVGLDADVLRLATIMAILPSTLITATTVWLGVRRVLRSIKQSFKGKYQILQHFGLSTFLETEWIRLNVPSLLRTFWLSRCLQQMLAYIVLFLGASNLASTLNFPTLEKISLVITSTVKDLMTRGNETTMAVLGMTSIVASICHHIGSMFHAVLTETKTGNVGGTENDEEKSVGSVSAVLFFVLVSIHYGIIILIIELYALYSWPCNYSKILLYSRLSKPV